MLHTFLIYSILTLSFTYYSWYSLQCGARYFWKSQFPEEKYKERKLRLKHSYVVPVYMWDIYNNGINSSKTDVVRGIYPTFIGASFNSNLYRNRKRRQLQFDIPELQPDEVLVKGEVRIMIDTPNNHTIYFQIYLKSEKWIFLDEKKASTVNGTQISFEMSSKKILKPGSMTFLIITMFQKTGKNCCEADFLHPALLLSYFSKTERNHKNNLERRKRSLGLEDYEEKINRFWRDEILPQKISRLPAKMRSSCRRKPLYIKFSEIDYDSWIVAPTGYEAFQCVGKCTFPFGEHLSPTKHAILQTLLHNISPWKASRACCVPTRLDPISILYVDENGVLTYRFRYRDMVVAECGCR